jgi:hypothetical protein
MVKAGFTKLAGTLSLRLLEIRRFMEPIENGLKDGRSWWNYRVTAPGVKWLLSNQNLFALHRHPTQRPAPAPAEAVSDFAQGITDDDVPF